MQKDPIAELERLYKYVNDQPELRDEAKAELVKLQQGDAENPAIWQKIIDLSMQEFDKTYQRLGVTFDHTLGESFYNPMLQDVVEELTAKGIARESEGAICVFFEDDPELKKAAPLIIQKADGAFLYGTTDMATLQVPHQTVASGRNHLCDRRAPATAFQAGLRRGAEMVDRPSPTCGTSISARSSARTANRSKPAKARR